MGDKRGLQLSETDNGETLTEAWKTPIRKLLDGPKGSKLSAGS